MPHLASIGTCHFHSSILFAQYSVCLANGVIAKDGALVLPLDETGAFTAEVSDFAGRNVKDADKDIIKHLKAAGRLVHAGTIVHSYPFCWRSDTPLIYRAIPSWFVRVESLVERLLANNAQSYWCAAAMAMAVILAVVVVVKVSLWGCLFILLVVEVIVRTMMNSGHAVLVGV